METRFRIRALRLIAQDAQLADCPTRILHALITASPVALRGEETMVPISELAGRLHGPMERHEHAPAAPDVLEALEEVATARWRIPSGRGFAIGGFLSVYWLGKDAGFVHFQVDDGFIAALEKVGSQLAASARDFPK